MCAAMPGRWSYRRDGDRPEVEYAFWSGTVAPGMALHFHPQIQLTAVLAGGRTFQVGHQIFTVLAGQCLYIPAGMPHKSLPVAHEDTRCLNIYLDLDGFGGVGVWYGFVLGLAAASISLTWRFFLFLSRQRKLLAQPA